jgi:hypothetical protein
MNEHSKLAGAPALNANIVRGSAKFRAEGSWARAVETNDLGPGSFVSVAAEVPHFAHCVATVECEVLIEQDRSMDVKFDSK